MLHLVVSGPVYREQRNPGSFPVDTRVTDSRGVRTFLWWFSPRHLIEGCLLHERQTWGLHRANPASSQGQHLTSPCAAHERDGVSFTFLSQKMPTNPSEQDLDTAENATGEVSSQRKCFAQFPFPPKTSDIHICLQNRVCYRWWQDISLGTALSFGLRLFSSW